MSFKMKQKLFFLLLLLPILGIAQENPFEAYKARWINKPTPDFRFKDISGKEFFISDLQGKVILLNFWFTNCSGCRAEYAGLQTLKNRFSDQSKVAFLSLATDEKEKLKAFLQKNPLNFQHMAESYDIGGIIYGVLGYPTNIILDQKGLIRHIKIGGSAQSADDLEYEMKLLLKN